MGNVILYGMITTPSVLAGMAAGAISKRITCLGNREVVCHVGYHAYLGAITGLITGILLSCIVSNCCGQSSDRKKFEAAHTPSSADMGSLTGSDNLKKAK